MGLGVVWLQFDGPFIVTDRLTGLAEPAGDISQTVTGLGVFIFGFDDLCKAVAGILVVLGIAEGYPKIVSGPRKIRLEGDALAVGSDGLVKFALLVKLVTALEMKGRRPQQLLLSG